MKAAANRLFVSYAHADQPLAGRLIADLRVHLQSCTATDCSLWIDRVILCGEAWDSEIKAALESSAMGLLLLSPAFRCSRYIQETELPVLLEKKCLPVGLKLLDLDTQLGEALQPLQLFRHEAPRKGPVFYSECTTTAQREAFAFGLYQQIRQRVQS